MKKLKFALISGLALLIISAEALAQTPQDSLKDGVLLVRLATQSRKISALEDSGQNEEALAVANQQKIENDLIIAAFTQTYTYSKVYFYYGTHGQKVLDKDWEGVLMNDQKELVEVSANSFFLIAAFTETDGSKIDGLIIYDQYGHQMKKPFPYLTREKHLFNFLKRSHGDMIKLFQESL